MPFDPCSASPETPRHPPLPRYILVNGVTLAVVVERVKRIGMVQSIIGRNDPGRWSRPLTHRSRVELPFDPGQVRAGHLSCSTPPSISISLRVNYRRRSSTWWRRALSCTGARAGGAPRRPTRSSPLRLPTDVTDFFFANRKTHDIFFLAYCWKNSFSGISRRIFSGELWGERSTGCRFATRSPRDELREWCGRYDFDWIQQTIYQLRHWLFYATVDGELEGRGETVRKIRTALEASGIEFIEENGTGEGVRFRKPRHSRRK